MSEDKLTSQDKKDILWWFAKCTFWLIVISVSLAFCRNFGDRLGLFCIAGILGSIWWLRKTID
jgi:hypothetical protein